MYALPIRLGTLRDSPWFRPILACSLILAVVELGTNFAPWSATPEAPVVWKIPASASDGGDDMRMATGAVSDDVEGVFFLDVRLGKLICSIYNPASSSFNSFFQRDVAADLQLDGVQKPKFLLVTGELNGPRRSSQMIGNSIVYVLETTSSRFAAYGVPWRGDLYASGRPQVGSFLLLHVGLAREGTGSP